MLYPVAIASTIQLSKGTEKQQLQITILLLRFLAADHPAARFGDPKPPALIKRITQPTARGFPLLTVCNH